MLLESFMNNGKAVEGKPITFEYRARNPVFVDKQQHLKGKFSPNGDSVFVWAEDDRGVVGMTGTLVLDKAA